MQPHFCMNFSGYVAAGNLVSCATHSIFVHWNLMSTKNLCNTLGYQINVPASSIKGVNSLQQNLFRSHL